MRKAGFLSFASMFLLAFALNSGAYAQYGPPSVEMTPDTRLGYEEPVIVQGTLSSFNMDENTISVNTLVPGLFGPEQRDVPLKLDKDTTISICFESIDRCESGLMSKEGLRTLSNLEGFSSFAPVEKQVMAIADPAQERIVHVEVMYKL